MERALSAALGLRGQTACRLASGLRFEAKPREDGRRMSAALGCWTMEKPEGGDRKTEGQSRWKKDDRCAWMMDDRSQRSEPGEIRCASSWRKFHRLKVGRVKPMEEG